MYDKYDDVKNPNYRGDIFDLARKAGYSVVTNKEDFAALRPGSGKAWGVFNKTSLDFAIDRTGRHPQLADVVARTGAFIGQVAALEGDILVSTHAIAMKGALEYLTPDSHGSYWSKYIGNCEVYVAEADNGDFSVPVRFEDGE